MQIVKLVSVALALLINVNAALAADQPLPAEALEKIRAAAPDKAPAKPAATRKLLV